MSLDNSSGLQRFSKGTQRKLEGLEDLEERAHKEYTKLCRTSVRIQSTDESLYN